MWVLGVVRCLGLHIEVGRPTNIIPYHNHYWVLECHTWLLLLDLCLKETIVR